MSENHKVAILLFLVHLCINSNMADECPRSCTCHDQHNLHVNCSRQLLSRPPKTSGSTLTIDLSYNALGPVLNTTFVQMHNLTLIDLSHNGLTLLIGCTFNGMLGLKTVSLSENRLASLPEDLFTDASKLEHLDISHNLFAELPNEVFKNLPQLKTLDASHNSILHLTLGIRLQVRHLSLSLANITAAHVQKHY